MHPLFGFLDFLGPSELIIIGIVAILLYGERLPEVARSWGKQFSEVKKSIQSVRQEFESTVSDVTQSVAQATPKEDFAEREEATAPKFEPPPAEPGRETH